MDFSSSDLKIGKQLVLKKKVKSPLFSGGTYQVEVTEAKEAIWPFLQLGEEGEILDAFCTCEKAEKKRSCEHLAGAFLKIMGSNGIPLHVRFRDSFWNGICWAASQRYGYEAHFLKTDKGEFRIDSPQRESVIILQPLNQKGKRKLEEILFKRPIETEATSLKFSKLSFEELELWKQGRPTENLRYELSFWSDLAKWWMELQETGKSYQIDFLDADEFSLPSWLVFSFDEIKGKFFVFREDWLHFIPTLATVKTTLKVFFTGKKEIEKITYDPSTRKFFIKFFSKEKKFPPFPSEKMVEVDGWIYLPKIGFFPKTIDPLLQKEEISQIEIADFLDRHSRIVKKYLKREQLYTEPVSVQYELFFDEKQYLHIRAYLFEKGDLTSPQSALFGKYGYLPGKGFYILRSLLFGQIEKVISKEKISDFVNRYRLWLQSFEEFQIHVSAVGIQLAYRVNQEGTLEFFSRTDFTEEKESIIEFDEWIYVKGKGFYAKAVTKTPSRITPFTKVAKEDVSSFIHQNFEELETIPGFFSPFSPIEKVGLIISLNKRGRIQVSPKFFFRKNYRPEQVKIFGDFTFVEGEGFARILLTNLPEEYRQEKEIEFILEASFISYELERLQPYILSLDNRLRRAEEINVKLNSIKRDFQSKVGPWICEFVLETEIGKISLFEIWKGMQERKHHLFSEAGTIILKDNRFIWLKSIGKKRWLKNGKLVRLTTMEWLKVCAIEEIEPPIQETKLAIASRKLLEQFQTYETIETLDLSGLKSLLRPYQQVGIKWLFFSYCYGLSCLLCDEMGLGKTHQALALIAASRNLFQNRKKIYLVVCPTSVIFHWQKLIEQFLPSLKTYLFHGGQRKIDLFLKGDFELLLTSYGIVRSEIGSLKNLFFEISIFDELQIAKNPRSRTYLSLKKIQAKMRLGLTGTPIENRLAELKALFDLILPQYLPPESQFRQWFINPIEKEKDEEKKRLLSRLIRPFLLRRKKSEVLLELPEKTEELAICELSEEQKKIYRNLLLEYQNPILEKLKETAGPAPTVHIFALLSKLKQICDHPCLITKQIHLYEKHQSGKWDLFVELLSEARESGQKVVVFSQYLDMLDIIELYLKKNAIGYASIRGSTIDRKTPLIQFKEDASCEIFVGSLQAAGVGIDLITASVVIHYDRWWNPAKENQATDRVHRIGQSRGVQVFKLITKNTVEERIHELIEEKTALQKGILHFDQEDQISGVGKEEWLALFRKLNKDIINL
ncbi:MAG: DEAD/DEAH box helicase [Chlamydiae bacterium]|nr:DEAD/DEAH box helicase [Chlamydiota bacterium]